MDISKELRQCWRTPPECFQELNEKFKFSIDACASADNALCDRYWSEDDDALVQDWSKERAFCNPPFGRAKPFLQKAQTAELAVVLLPSNSLVTTYFSEYQPRVIAIPGRRIQYIPPRGIESSTASFGTTILVYGNPTQQEIESLRSFRYCPLSIWSPPTSIGDSNVNRN